MLPETNGETKKEQKCLPLPNRLITVIMKMIMIKDNDYANNSYIQYTDSFLLRYVFLFFFQALG